MCVFKCTIVLMIFLLNDLVKEFEDPALNEMVGYIFFMSEFMAGLLILSNGHQPDPHKRLIYDFLIKKTHQDMTLNINKTL